jgi:hypothetical protein
VKKRGKTGQQKVKRFIQGINLKKSIVVSTGGLAFQVGFC